MSALITSARRPKNPGPLFRHSQTITPATSTKLIHLKRFSADCCDAEPASSACALSARKSTENSWEAAILAYSLADFTNFTFIAILSVERPGAESVDTPGGVL